MSGEAAARPGAGKSKKGGMYPVHCVIGFAIMAVFWLIPPLEPITEIGMRVVGGFLMMVYLWSTIGTLWPSVVGLFFLGVSGVAGDAGFNGVFMNSIGNYMVLMCMFAFVLFGGLDDCGATMHIARWMLTRKVFKGRPLVFLGLFIACSFAMAALIGGGPAMIIMWPIGLRIMEILGVKREDSVWNSSLLGSFWALPWASRSSPLRVRQWGPSPLSLR